MVKWLVVRFDLDFWEFSMENFIFNFLNDFDAVSTMLFNYEWWQFERNGRNAFYYSNENFFDEQIRKFSFQRDWSRSTKSFLFIHIWRIVNNLFLYQIIIWIGLIALVLDVSFEENCLLQEVACGAFACALGLQSLASLRVSHEFPSSSFQSFCIDKFHKLSTSTVFGKKS